MFYTTVYKNMDGMIMRDFTSWVPALIRTSGFECAAVKSFVSASLPERLGVSTNTTVKVFKIEGIITCTTQSVIHVMKCVCSSVHLEKSRKSRTLNIEVLLEIIRIQLLCILQKPGWVVLILHRIGPGTESSTSWTYL